MTAVPVTPQMPQMPQMPRAAVNPAAAAAAAAESPDRRLLSAATGDLPGHLARFGELPRRGHPGGLVTELERAGLTGRGGAAFPAWRKVSAVGQGRRAVVIGNAAEGEPASAKDATLLTHAPHLVLDGLQLAADAVGAREVHLSVKSRAAADAAVRALAERRAANRDRHQVRVHRTPGGFLSGEASAVVAAVEGRPAVPGFTREHLSSSGVRGRPTLVQNVETLAHVALIARYGADWFRRVGTAEQPGTFLATISGAVRRPGVVEAGYGVPLGALLDRAGGPSAPLQAVLIGGYHGAWLPAEAVPEAPVSREGLAPWGASPGAGVVIALPTTACGLDLTARIVSYLAGQSAGQCAPCRNGLPLIADRLGMLAAGTGDPGVVGTVDRLTDLVEGRGVCHHPDGTVRLIRSALRTFADDVTAHLAGFCLATR